MPNSFIVWRAAVLSRRAGPERSGVITLARRKWRNEARSADREVCSLRGWSYQSGTQKPGIVPSAQQSVAVDLYLKEIKRTN